MVKEKKLNVNVTLNVIKNLCTVIFPFITFPYISRVLLVEDLGKISFSSSFISYFSLLAGLGVSTHAIRECSKVRKDKDALGKVSSQMFSINVLSTALAYLCLFFAILFVRKLDNYRFLILIQSTTMFTHVLGVEWINTAMEDFKYLTIRYLVFQLLSIAAMFIFVRSANDYLIYALISVFSATGANISNYFHRKKFCKIKFTFKIDFKKHLKPILFLFSTILVQQIYVNSDITILGWLRTDKEVGLYNASVRIYNMIQTLVTSVTLAVLPRMAGLFVKKDYSEINRHFSYATNFIVALGLPCLIGVILIAPEIITILSGVKYLDAVPSMRILMFALAFSFVGGLMGNLVLIPMGKENITLYSSILSAGINLVLNIILIPIWGIYAAAFTTVIAMLVGVLFKIPFMPKEIHLVEKEKVFYGPVIGALVIIVVCRFFNLTISDLILRTVFSVVVSATLYFVVLIAFKNDFGQFVLDVLKKFYRFIFKKGRLKK